METPPDNLVQHRPTGRPHHLSNGLSLALSQLYLKAGRSCEVGNVPYDVKSVESPELLFSTS